MMQELAKVPGLDLNPLCSPEGALSCHLLALVPEEAGTTGMCLCVQLTSVLMSV